MTSFEKFLAALVAAAALLVAVPAGPARAQQDPSAEDDERARELFRLGESHYAAGRYEKAAVLYDEAYRLSGRAELLLAMVNTYERMGEYKQAIGRLREYLKHPRAKNVNSLRDRLRRLEAAERQREAERDRIRRLEIAEQQRAQELRRLQELPARPPEQPGVVAVASRPSRLPAYLFLAGGVIGLGGAVGLGIVSNEAGQDAEAACTDGGVCRASAESALDREFKFALLSDISAGVGVASAAIGVYLLWRGGGDDSDERSALHVAPTALPGGVGLSVGGEL